MSHHALNVVDMIVWMKKISSGLHFVPETTYIALNFYDRYMSENRVVVKRQIRLLALTCVFMAGKIHEELCEPLIKEMFAFTKPGEYNPNDIKVCLYVLFSY